METLSGGKDYCETESSLQQITISREENVLFMDQEYYSTSEGPEWKLHPLNPDTSIQQQPAAPEHVWEESLDNPYFIFIESRSKNHRSRLLATYYLVLAILYKKKL